VNTLGSAWFDRSCELSLEAPPWAKKIPVVAASLARGDGALRARSIPVAAFDRAAAVLRVGRLARMEHSEQIEKGWN
jgi:hypothetical protein